MDLISNMDEPMDEVLLSSVVEACVRIRKPELLSTKLEPLKILPAAATQVHAGGRVAQGPCLKCLDAYIEERNIARTMNLISNMDEPVDEVLISSVVETCVRIRRPELLARRP